MAFTTGNDAPAYGQTDDEPYFTRLQPIDGGYRFPRNEIRVFDDRAAGGEIHVQFSAGRGRGTKVATFHCGSLSEYDDIVEALSLGRKGMPAS